MSRKPTTRRLLAVREWSVPPGQLGGTVAEPSWGEMDLHTYLRALRRYWWVLAISGVLGGAIGTILMFRATPIYASTVTFFATTPSSVDGNPLQGDQFGQQRVNSYVKLLGSQRLAERLVAKTKTDLSVRQVMRRIDGKADLNTVLFTATVRDSSKERGLALVTAIAGEFPKLVDEIESQNGAKAAPVALDVVSGPSLNPFPVSPKKRIGVAAGLFLGLLLGTSVALARVLLDRTFRTLDALRDVSGVPVLGTIPLESRRARKTPSFLDTQGQSSRAEAFRQLRTNLQFVDVEEPVSVLVVTSAAPAEGKSATSVHLAISFANNGKKVLLIEGDLRRPMVAEYLGLEGSVGLTNVLAGQVDLDDVMQQWGSGGLKVLPSGSVPPNPSELLGSQPMDELIAAARKRFDLVILDTPPLLPVTDAAIASRRADGAVVVVRYGRTRRAEIERAIDSLRKVDARILGTILNRTPNKGVDGMRYDTYEYRAKSGDFARPHGSHTADKDPTAARSSARAL